MSDEGLQNERTSRKFKLYVPDTSSELRRCSCQIIAFFVSCYTLAFLSLCLLLILQLMVIGYWASTYHALTIRMPKTFGWEVLIQMFGSLYNDCTDRSGLEIVQLTGPDHCSYDFSMPSLPIFSMIILIGTSLSGVACVIEDFFYKTSSRALRSLWVFTVLKFVLFMVAVIHLSLSFSGNEGVKNRLQSRMLFEMKISQFAESPSQISPRWNLAQFTYGCCGIRHFSDWEFNGFAAQGNYPLYPRSCCDQSKSHCKFYPNRTEVFETGCLDWEYSGVQNTGMMAIYLLCIGLTSTVLMALLLTLTHSIFQGDETRMITPFCQHPDNFSTDPLPVPVVPSTEFSTNTHIDGGGDQLPVFSIHNHDHCPNYKNSNTVKLLSLRRLTHINVHINTWGINVKSKTETMAQAQILKKETLV